MWPESLRGTFYFITVWVMCVIEMTALFFLPDHSQGFFYLYLIAWLVLAFATCFTAGFGVAEFLQARWDEKKLRRSIERELIG